MWCYSPRIEIFRLVKQSVVTCDPLTPTMILATTFLDIGIEEGRSSPYDHHVLLVDDNMWISYLCVCKLVISGV